MEDASPESPQQDITVTTNLLEAPEYAERIGHLTVAWANLEWQMYNVFQELCGAPVQLARASFYAIDSNRGRREILASVAAIVLKGRSDLSVLDNILRRIGKSAGQRNKYVHDTWCVASTGSVKVFQLRLGVEEGSRDMDEVSLEDLKAATDQFNKLSEELYEFRARVAPSLPALLDKLRSLPVLPLVFARKGQSPGRLPKGHHGQPPPSKR